MPPFLFKHFSITQNRSALKVGTDAMLLGAFIKSENEHIGLDIGAGTGVLSLMVVQKNPTIQIDAIELDNESIIDCQENFINSNWSERLSTISADFLKHEFDKKYDLIFSNPPFYQNSLVNENHRTAVSKHAVHLPFDRLFEKVSSLLSDTGCFWIIFPFDDFEKVTNLGMSNGLFIENKITIESKLTVPTRVILSFRKTINQVSEKTLVIRSLDNSFSDEYIELTKDFHGKKLT
jgi:tRNA1Val (adenine37-N6)-methyltransferase